MNRIKGLKKHFRASNLFVAGVVILMAVQALYYFGATRSMRALSLSCALTLIVIGVYVLYRVLRRLGIGEERTRLSVFVVMLVFMGLGYMYVFVPSTVPDEVYHFWSAYQLSNYLLFIDGNDGMNLNMRASDAEFFSSILFNTDLTPDRFVEMSSFFEISCTDASIVDSGITFDVDFSSNPIQDRLIPALGITVGRLLGLSPVITYYLGRVFNLIGFILLAVVSVRFTPIIKKGFMVMAIMPITTHLAASYSYDAFILGISMLLTALLLKAIKSHELLSWKMITGIIIVTVLLAPCKVIYSLIVVLAFFIPSERFVTKKQEILFKVLVPLAAIAVIAIIKLPTLLSMMGVGDIGDSADNLVKRGNEEGRYWTFTGFISKPSTAFMILMNTLMVQSDGYIISGIGGSLAWFQDNIVSPDYLVFPMLLVVLATSIKSEDDPAAISKSRRLILASVVIVGFFAVLMSLLTGWTFDTENVILGVQGRYMLPLLPLFLLAIRPKSLLCQMRLDFWLPYSMLTLSAINLARIMSRIYM